MTWDGTVVASGPGEVGEDGTVHVMLPSDAEPPYSRDGERCRWTVAIRAGGRDPVCFDLDCGGDLGDERGAAGGAPDSR